QQLDAEPVLDVDGLELLAVGREIELAVGHDAVDVEEQAADLRRAPLHFGEAHDLHPPRGFRLLRHQTTPARSRSCMWIAPASLPESSTTSSGVILCFSINCTASAAR